MLIVIESVTVSPTFVLADINNDRIVNFFDVAPFIEVLSSGSFRNAADINRDGIANFFDIQPFIGVLSNQ